MSELLEARLTRLAMSRTELPVIFFLLFQSFGLGFFTSLMGAFVFWVVFESVLRVCLQQAEPSKHATTTTTIGEVEDLRAELEELKWRISILEQQRVNQSDKNDDTSPMNPSEVLQALLDASEDEFAY
ncbi:hypothetical protein BASA81_001002 [Batrachochytrium salamandrivorans]|nr:hypothetical protein BASA81_005399 [Batrachochytrium salamandrivorans]KAH9260535.1 hypothetical protein BASA81_001002 [Batrachochytrium salamandrivorans]